jgi:hypothetical protein
MNTPHIIHNPKNVTRHLNLLEQLSSQGIEEWNISPAIYANTRRSKDAGRVGVALAHKKIVEDNYNKEQITIFEDDIVFTSKDSWKKYWEWYEELPENWQVYTGGCYRINSKVSVTDNLEMLRGFGGAHFYTIRKRYYDKFLACPESKHIDTHMGETATVYAPKLLVSRQMELDFEGKDARSERKGNRIVNYKSIRRRHKYLT